MIQYRHPFEHRPVDGHDFERRGVNGPNFDLGPCILEDHADDCPCCASAPAEDIDDDRLDAVALGKLAVLGFVIASAIMFAVDPAGAAWALLDAIGWWPR